ncbi:MAG: hypothetical protein HZA77_00205 [Candidatus Schekmanbacteria bacterium]|nr:hypothetical protein [Candidatus Schekmanbacteria bacterium]
MNSFKNLEKIHEEAKRYFIPFCEDLLSSIGGEIASISVYGSVASGEFIPSNSDINSVFVLNNLDFNFLRKSHQAVTAGIKRKITAPLFLTGQMIQNSSDVFPMEFSEIKENHVLIYGTDFFSSLVISEKALRLQCEQQIKGKILLLRQAYLESGGKSKQLEAIMVNSISSIFPLFRSALRLKGLIPPVSKDELIVNVGREFGMDSSIFIDILRDKKGDARIGKRECDSAFETYMEELQKLADIIDAL